ncbi:MAG: nucleotidyl transferase AbiEii/AbiGii toxin family protein [Bacteroidales bacterium]|nr:nucleotidyl transferase AbiEii/AbiGii toxin family protein [Bacteroidales bacterium]
MILELLKKITQLLEGNDFPYMVSGSQALNWYVNPRMTMDIDIVIELDMNNVDRFITLFLDGFYINVDTVKKEAKYRGIFNLIDFETGYKIDFIVRKDAEYRINEFKRRIRIRYNEFEMWVVSPEDLIISKILWIQTYTSEKQMEDIKTLLLLEKLDFNYINKWCEKLNLNTFNLL